AVLIFWIINHRTSDLFGFKILTAAGGLAPLYAVLILLLVVSSKLFKSILINRVSEFLGEISYALYILQLPVYLAFKLLSPSIFIYSPSLAFCLY
ncbi:hypothetical protein NL393_32110, partial [Klebsiella pneumoniae]|nr:hypothetical protein [Klebsiella pneumoniae]